MAAATVAPRPGPRRRWRRVLLWGLLIALLAVAQALLVFLVLQYEAARAQDRAEAAAAAVASEARLALSRSVQALQLLAWTEAGAAGWRGDAAQLLRTQPELVRLERRNGAFDVIDAVQAPHLATLFEAIPRREQSQDAQVACVDAERSGAPAFSRSYFSPLAQGVGFELLDLCLPAGAHSQLALVATFSLTRRRDAPPPAPLATR